MLSIHCDVDLVKLRGWESNYLLLEEILKSLLQFCFIEKNLLKKGSGKDELKKAGNNSWDILFSVTLRTFQNEILKLLLKYLFAE